ncbi:hypothetical protein, partial [Vreelandella stevensii]|uniref:hypothetical protein n=1 Tax=Vreelandella stevensii TaxID=502821 RepID=UPI00374969D1
DTLEQMANIQVLNRGAAAVPPMAAPALATAAINAPAAAAAGYTAYRSPVGQCVKEASQNVVFEAFVRMSDPLVDMPDAKDLADQDLRNRTAQMERDTRPRVRIPDILICRR